jgi:hypothetical protein
VEVRRQSLADLLLVASISMGLFVAPFLALIAGSLLLRQRWWRIDWRSYHWLLLAAILWAVVAVVTRGEKPSFGLMLYFGYLWMFPLFVALYRPDENTLRAFAVLIGGLFALDLLFNVFTIFTGADPLGRTLDARQGVAGGRAGGLFGHSFYSGSISIATLVLAVGRVRSSSLQLVLGMLAIGNMIAAGSWRLPMAAMIIFAFSVCWRSLSRKLFALAVVFGTLLTIAGVVATSGLLGTALDDSLSNTFRLFAWNLALEKIVDSPLMGVGIPDMSQVEAMSFESIDEFLIAESWYLSSALAFGIPYTVLYVSVLAAAFFGKNFQFRSKVLSLLLPLVLIDLIAGEFFSGILIYSWLWLEIGLVSSMVSAPVGAEADDSLDPGQGAVRPPLPG